MPGIIGLAEVYQVPIRAKYQQLIEIREFN